MKPSSMETIIKNAEKHGYYPVRYPTGELFLRKCPACLQPGKVATFRDKKEEQVDIFACTCGFRRYDG